MNVHIARDGETIGEYEESLVRDLVQSGQILPTDHFWLEGMGSWEPISTRYKVSVPPTAPIPTAHTNPCSLCPSCKGKVSPQAEVCPHCGHPLKRGFMGKAGVERSLNLGCLFIIVVVVLVVLLFAL